MAGKRIIFIPFEGGVGADTSINGTVESYKDKYRNCRVVQWSYYRPDKDWSNDQENSPLGEGVNVEEDVIIIAGHGSAVTSALEVKTTTSKPGLVLTDNEPTFENGQMRLSVEEVAARLRWMGLRTNHKYIKTLSCCGAGLGEFEFGPKKVHVEKSLNDTFPHLFARDLAKELFRGRIWKKKEFWSHLQIQVGGYPGYVSCKVGEPKLVSMLVKNDDQTPTTMQTVTNWAGLNGVEDMKREPYNRFTILGLGHDARRVILVPPKEQGRELVPVIWYDGLGRALYAPPAQAQAPLQPQIVAPAGFRKQPK